MLLRRLVVRDGELDVVLVAVHVLLQRAVLDAVVEVHDEAERHPDREPDQRQDGQLQDQVDVHRDGDGWHERQAGSHEHERAPERGSLNC